MQQLDLVAEIEWNTLLATKTMHPNVAVEQYFFVGASILARKWQDHVDHYDNFCQQAIKIVSELGPPFE